MADEPSNADENAEGEGTLENAAHRDDVQDFDENVQPRDAVEEPQRAARLKHADETRRLIALLLLFLLLFVLAVGAVAALTSDAAWKRMEGFLNLVFTGVITLTTTAVTFYYTSRKFEDEAGRRDRDGDG